MTKRRLTLVNAMHITASVFLSLRSGQASTTTKAACTTIASPSEGSGQGVARRTGSTRTDGPGRPGGSRSKDRGHNRTGEDACPGRGDRVCPGARACPERRGRNADAHLKRHGPRGCGGGDQRPARWLRFAHRDLWHVGADLVSLDGR
jgi:hypothetical protein